MLVSSIVVIVVVIVVIVVVIIVVVVIHIHLAKWCLMLWHGLNLDIVLCQLVCNYHYIVFTFHIYACAQFQPIGVR